MVKISVVIITFNEEKNVGKCIDSVRPVADEIIVVDSFSSDKTKQICEEKGVRFIERSFKNHSEQKNFASGLATNDQILSLDADEYLSETLVNSIIEIKGTWPAQAYRMNRLSNYGGKWIKHGSWYPDRKIRLWNRQLGHWNGENPHEKVVLRSAVAIQQLKGDLLHRAYRDISETLTKIQLYSDIFAREHQGLRNSSLTKIFFRSTFAFLKSYFFKRGFLDGFEGLMVAMAVANHVSYKYSKLYVANHRASLGKRVIISRTDNLGDVILTLPMVGFLKSVIPDLEIFFIGKQYTKAIIQNCCFVDRFLDREELLREPNLMTSLAADSILFVFPDKELARIARKAEIPIRVATSHRLYNWLYCNRLVNFSRMNSDLHESQLNFKLLTPFKLLHDIDLDEMVTYYGLKSSGSVREYQVNPEKFNLIIHPKSKGSAREWGLSHYDALISALPADLFQIFISGLKEEGEVMHREVPSIFNRPNVEDLTGKMSLDEMISFVGEADGLLACSTGMLHVAAALGKYALGLYAPMRPIHPGRWKPVGVNGSYLVLNKTCNDCRDQLECACIKAITVEQVREKVIGFAKAARADKRSI